MKKFIWLVAAVVVVAGLWWYFGGSSQQAVAPSAPTAPSAATTSTAAASPVPSAYFNDRTSAALGMYLTDPNGMTLYTFTHDTAGVSNCAGACLAKWPPYGPGIRAATGTVVNLPMLPVGVGTIKGNNGMIQFTWQGMPLYYYFQDKAAGDTLGEGILGAWYVVKM